jgi:hypothetical protein
LQGQPEALKEWGAKQQDATRNSFARRVEEIAGDHGAMAAAKEKKAEQNGRWLIQKQL